MLTKPKTILNSSPAHGTSGQTSVGYVLTIAVMALGVASILYGPVMMGLRLLYIDAATRVIGEGPDIDAQIRKAQTQVLGSSSIYGGLFSESQSKAPSPPAPASRSQPRGWDNAGSSANSTSTNSPSGTAPGKPASSPSSTQANMGVDINPAVGDLPINAGSISNDPLMSSEPGLGTEVAQCEAK